jgi:hypothetical protein
MSPSWHLSNVWPKEMYTTGQVEEVHRSDLLMITLFWVVPPYLFIHYIDMFEEWN